MSEARTVFKTLRELDVTSKHKSKNNLTYLPWASAWAAVKSVYPGAKFTVVHSPTDNIYWTDGKTCWVETSVEIEGEVQNETLAVMDYRNMAISAEKVQSTEVEKSIRRCLTKNLALFGLDLNLWEGEELSDEAAAKAAAEEAERKAQEAELQKAIKKVIDEGTKLIKRGVAREDIFSMVESVSGHPNPSNIKDIAQCETILEELKRRFPAEKKKKVEAPADDS